MHKSSVGEVAQEQNIQIKKFIVTKIQSYLSREVGRGKDRIFKSPIGWCLQIWLVLGFFVRVQQIANQINLLECSNFKQLTY